MLVPLQLLVFPYNDPLQLDCSTTKLFNSFPFGCKKQIYFPKKSRQKYFQKMVPKSPPKKRQNNRLFFKKTKKTLAEYFFDQTFDFCNRTGKYSFLLLWNNRVVGDQ